MYIGIAKFIIELSEFFDRGLADVFCFETDMNTHISNRCVARLSSFGGSMHKKSSRCEGKSVQNITFDSPFSTIGGVT